MSNRHGRAPRARQGFNLGIELLRQRLDDARAKPGFSLSEHAVRRLADPIVGDRKLPVRSAHVICDGDLAFVLIAGKGVFQCIHDEFGHDQAETLRLTGRGAASFADHFQRNGPGVANHRRRKALAQLCKIRRDLG